MPLFEVAILEIPTKKESEEGQGERLAFGPTFVVAKDSQSAAMRAVMENPESMKFINRDRMQVLVRPFA